MAQRTVVTRTDDLDGSDPAESVTFSVRDTVYSIDLTSRNQQKLLRALEPFITAGTVVSRPPRTPRTSAGVRPSSNRRPLWPN